MKFIKGVLTYTGILALIAAGLCIIAAGYLFLFPQNDLFGIKFIQFDGFKSELIEDVSEVKELTIKAESFDVIIIPGKLDTTMIHAKVTAKFNGFGLKETEEVKLTTTKESNKVIIKLEEPDGLYSRNDCLLEVTIPATMLNNILDLNISTTKANVELGYAYETDSTQYFNINDLSLTTNSGIFNINCVNFVNDTSDTTTELITEVGKGKAYFTKDMKGTISKATIDTSDGRVTFAENSNLFVGKLVWNNSNVGRLSAHILNNLEATTNGGVLTVDEVDTVSLFGTNTTVNIGTVKTTSSINLSRSGNVNIEHVKDYIEINNVKGNVTVLKADEAISVVTKSGNIKIVDATKQVYAESSSGNINLTFADGIASYSEDQKLRFAQIITKTGKVKVSNVDYILVDSKEGGAPTVEVFFHDLAVNKQSKINSNGGKIKVITPFFKEAGENAIPSKPFVVKTNTTGAVDLHIHTEKQTLPGEQNSYLYGAGEGCATTIELNAKSGGIYVRSAQFYNAEV